MKNMENKKCECCGYNILPKNSMFEICPVCDWQDDPVQNEDSNFAGGANKLSLNEYKKKWQTEHNVKIA